MVQRPLQTWLLAILLGTGFTFARIGATTNIVSECNATAIQNLAVFDAPAAEETACCASTDCADDPVQDEPQDGSPCGGCPEPGNCSAPCCFLGKVIQSAVRMHTEELLVTARTPQDMPMPTLVMARDEHFELLRPPRA